MSLSPHYLQGHVSNSHPPAASLVVSSSKSSSLSQMFLLSGSQLSPLFLHLSPQRPHLILQLHAAVYSPPREYSMLFPLRAVFVKELHHFAICSPLGIQGSLDPLDALQMEWDFLRKKVSNSGVIGKRIWSELYVWWDRVYGGCFRSQFDRSRATWYSCLWRCNN